MSESEQHFFVYVLIDPRESSKREGIFYVGKGKGNRPLSHELEVGESEKIQRIKEIRAAGRMPEIELVTRDGVVAMTETEAFLTEAALIWAMQGQLTNKVSGHNFSLTPEASLKVLANAKDVAFRPTDPALFVWTKGARGGTSIMGDFIKPDDENLWENARRDWVFGKEKLATLDSRISEQKPTALVSLTSGKRGLKNIVIGVFQIAGWKKEKGKVIFSRIPQESEDALITEMREYLVGNQLLIDGKILCPPNSHGAPEGQKNYA